MKDRLQTGFIGFIYKNKITLVLTIVLFSLLKQNVIDNDFPGVLFEREESIDKIRLNNANLSNENKILETRIESYTEENLNLIDVICSDKFIMSKIAHKKLRSIFNYSKHFKNVNLIFRRVFK